MAEAKQEKTLVRSNQVLFKKFSQYLIPTMITYAALSLNEFVDSMLVSNMLGPDAMAIVGLGAPIMLIMAAIYSLLGSGGSTVYETPSRVNSYVSRTVTGSIPAFDSAAAYFSYSSRRDPGQNG